jgi:dihydropteroate synthase
MSQQTNYSNLLEEILYYFSEKVAAAKSYGINDIILDPGFGFAKNTFQNFSLLQHLNLFKTFELPILVGLSRKSMIYKTLGTNPDQALNGTTALNTYALTKGANILRVHDVKEAVECIELLEALKQTED